jgi:hypothetical protein
MVTSGSIFLVRHHRENLLWCRTGQWRSVTLSNRKLLVASRSLDFRVSDGRSATTPFTLNNKFYQE